MKSFLRFCIILVCVFLQRIDLLKAQNSTYFISPQGLDTNNGSLQSPLKTISKALSIAIGDTVNIYILKGDYFIQNCNYINNVNQFKSVIIKSYNKSNAKLMGGKIISVEDITNVKSNKSIYCLDLKKIGVDNIGSIKRNGFGDKLLPSYIELFINNESFELARWPNNSLIKIDSVINKGIKNNLNESKPSFFCKELANKKWPDRGGVWIGGQFSVGWSYETLPVDNINLQTKIVKLKEYANYGIYSSTDTVSDVIKAAKNLRGLYFYNIFEELDNPGEYYIDKDKYLMYFFPKRKLKKGDEIAVSVMEEPIFKIVNSSNITIEDLDFSYTRGKFIEILKCNNIKINNCRFNNSGLLGLDINHSNEIKVLNSKIVGSGAGGVYIEGGNRQELLSSKNLIYNCEFTNYSRNFRSFTPAINIEGVGVTVQNCYIHDAYDQAILYMGNNHEISFNIVKNVCQSFSDIGAIGTGRDPSSTGTRIENNYFENIRNSYSPMITAIYIDDGSGGITVHDNVFRNCGSITNKGFGAIHINGGANNRFTNNIFIDCSIAFSSTYWSDQYWENRFLKDSLSIAKLTKTVNINSNIYLKNYPYLRDFFDTKKSKSRINYIYNTVKYGKDSAIKGKGFQVKNNIYLKDKPSLFINRNHTNIINLPSEVKNWAGWDDPKIDSMGIVLEKDINNKDK